MALTGWANSQRLYISADEVLYNAAVTIFLSVSCGVNGIDMSAVFDDLGSNSLKIAIEYGDTAQQLYAEIERWDAVNEIAILHVKVPQINISNTYLTLYWDATHADNTTYIGSVGSAAGQAAQDGNASNVYQMADDPTTNTLVDSLGDTNGVITQTLTEITTDNLPGLQFDGDSGWVQIDAACANLDGDFSVAVDFRIPSAGADNDILFSSHDTAYANRFLIYRPVSSNKIRVIGYSATGSEVYYGTTPTTNIADNARHTCVVTYNDTSLEIKVYIDGVLELSGTASAAIDITTGHRASIGQEFDGSTPGDYLNGSEYNLTLLATDVSAGWSDLYHRSRMDNLVTWDVIVRAEHAYYFDTSTLTEQFHSYFVTRAPFVQASYQFQIRPALRTETGYLFSTDRAKFIEKGYNFDLIAYKQYQDTYDFKVRAGEAFTEQDYPFTILARSNELYEEMFTLQLNGLTDNFSVKAGLSTIVDSVALDAIKISGERNGYYNLFRVQVPYDQRFRTLGLGGLASLTWYSARLQGATVTPVVDKTIPLIYKQAAISAAATDQGDDRTATLDLVSPTAQLDRLPNPLHGSNPVTTVWPAGTLVSEVLDDLCLPYLPYTLEYGDYLLLQALDGGKRYPIEIINELYPLAWIGPDNDGNLLIRDKLPRSWDELLSPGFDDYDLELDESEYAIDIQHDYPSTPLYNAVTVRTVAESDAVIFPAPEIIQDAADPSKATVYGYRYPWVRFDLVTCNTECGNVQIPAGAEEIIEVTEALDFEGGAASFPLPVHEFVAVDWGCNRSLGTITASGDGTLQAAVSEWSFGLVTCKVRRMVFGITVYNGRPDDLKFRLRDE